VWTPVGSYNKPTTKTAPNAGLRPSLPFISETPVRLAKPATVSLTGKGNKKRYVPIMGKTCDLLKNYLEENRLVDNGKQNYPLFYNSSRQPFTRPGITYVLEKNLKKAKALTPKIQFPDKLKPHMMRQNVESRYMGSRLVKVK
jgi:site-specific recombinase XerD